MNVTPVVVTNII